MWSLALIAPLDCIRKIIESTITGDAPTFDDGMLYGAIALARQASLEGTHIFPTYCSWFKVYIIIQKLRCASWLLTNTLSLASVWGCF